MVSLTFWPSCPAGTPWRSRSSSVTSASSKLVTCGIVAADRAICSAIVRRMRESFSTRTGPQASFESPSASWTTASVGLAVEWTAASTFAAAGWTSESVSVNSDGPGGPSCLGRGNIFRRDAAVLAAAGDRAQIDALLAGHSPHGGSGGNGTRTVDARRQRLAAQANRLRFRGCWRRAAGGMTQVAACRRERARQLAPARRRFRFVPTGDREHDLADFDRVAFLDEQLAHAAGVRAGNLDDRLVGLQLEDAVVGGDLVALVDQHAHHVAAMDVLAEFGKLEVDVHARLLLALGGGCFLLGCAPWRPRLLAAPLASAAGAAGGSALGALLRPPWPSSSFSSSPACRRGPSPGRRGCRPLSSAPRLSAFGSARRGSKRSAFGSCPAHTRRLLSIDMVVNLHFTPPRFGVLKYRLTSIRTRADRCKGVGPATSIRHPTPAFRPCRASSPPPSRHSGPAADCRGPR